MKTKRIIFVLLSITFVAVATFASGIGNENVMLWRKDGSGHFEDVHPPMDWNDSENTLWETPLDHSNASPIKIGNRLYLTEEPSTVICADATTGEIIWKRENRFLDLLGMSEEELKAAESVLAASKELDRKIAKVTYRLNRASRKGAQQNNWNEQWSVVYWPMMKEYNELSKQKEALHADESYGQVVLPAIQVGNGYSSYVPITDGERIYVSFGTGVVLAFDLEGNRLWHRIMEHPDHNWGGSTFPTLVSDVLIVRFKDYTGLDKNTGEELWRIPSPPTMGSPSVFQVEGKPYLLTARGRVLRPRDGKLIGPEAGVWNPTRYGVPYEWNSKPYAMAFCCPLIDNTSVYLIDGSQVENTRNTAVYKLQIPDTVEELEKSGLEIVWKAGFRDRFYASPLLYQGILYVAGSSNILTALDAESGRVIYSQKIQGMLDPLFSSVTLVGDSIFLGSGDGVAVFVQPGREYKELTRNKLSAFRSSPIFEGNVAYLRATESLIAFGKR